MALESEKSGKSWCGMPGWEGVLDSPSVQGMWSSEEFRMQINVPNDPPTLQTAGLGPIQQHHSYCIHISSRHNQESSHSLRSGPHSDLGRGEHLLSTGHIPRVENWQADFSSHQQLDSGEWPFPLEIFHSLCLLRGMPDVNLLASRFNHKLYRFVPRSRNPQTFGVDALVSPLILWSGCPSLSVDSAQLDLCIHPLKLLPYLLRRIEREGIPVIPFRLDWTRKVWYYNQITGKLCTGPT